MRENMFTIINVYTNYMIRIKMFCTIARRLFRYHTIIKTKPYQTLWRNHSELNMIYDTTTGYGR